MGCSVVFLAGGGCGCGVVWTSALFGFVGGGVRCTSALASSGIGVTAGGRGLELLPFSKSGGTAFLITFLGCFFIFSSGIVPSLMALS